MTLAQRVLVLAGAEGGGGHERREQIADILRSRGRSVAMGTVDHGAAATRAVRRGAAADAIVTTGSVSAHLAGLAVKRRGVPWILDLDAGWPARRSLSGGHLLHRRLEMRLARTADVVVCSSEPLLDDLHRRIGAASFVLPAAGGTDADRTLVRQLDALGRKHRRGGGLRVLMLGPINSPHVEHLSLAMDERGIEVLTAGEVWPDLPPSVLPSAGLAVDTATAPFVVWLRRLVGQMAPDVVHAHWTPFAFKALLAGARPLVVTPWGSDVYRAEGRFAWANGPVARFADRVVTDSQDLVDAMVRLGASPQRTVLLNWGVDLARFSPPAEPRPAIRGRLGLGPGPMVLSPRSLKPLYNPEVIVEAFRRVRRSVPDAQLVLKHMAAESPPLDDLPEGTQVVSHVPYETMADYYRAADVMVSIPDTDSSPRSVWEAMACGCPCVVSDLPWVHETMDAREDALVVPVEAGAVASAIERALQDPGELPERGRALVERTRDQQAEMDRLAELYRQVAGR